jgi:hypothetical protein
VEANGDPEFVERNGEPVPVDGNDLRRNKWRPRMYKWRARAGAGVRRKRRE